MDVNRSLALSHAVTCAEGVKWGQTNNGVLTAKWNSVNEEKQVFKMKLSIEITPK